MQNPTEILRWRLASDVHAYIELRGEVSQEAIDKMIALLSLMKECFPEATPGLSSTEERKPYGDSSAQGPIHADYTTPHAADGIDAG